MEKLVKENKTLRNNLKQLSFASGLVQAGGEFSRLLYLGAFETLIPNKLREKISKLEEENKTLRERIFQIAHKYTNLKLGETFKRLADPDYKSLNQEIEDLFAVEIEKNKLLEERILDLQTFYQGFYTGKRITNEEYALLEKKIRGLNED